MACIRTLAVNGLGFWTEGLRGSLHDGTFHPHPLPAPQVEAGRVSWSVITDWRAPDGSLLLSEEQRWSFVNGGDQYRLTLDRTLQAASDLT